MATILITDDEADIVNALEIYLKPEGYMIRKASNGEEAIRIIKQEAVDLVLLDIMMPGMDGITALSLIREFSNIPVIFLSAKGEDSDKILGLNIGADDYITKPFNPTEVIARVRSQLRRYMHLGGSMHRGVLQFGGILLDDQAKTVKVDGNDVFLTPMEFGILKLLMETPGRVFSSAEIYKAVWKEPPLGSEGTVAVHIRHLREKIEIDPGAPRYLKVVWGQGYKMEDSNA